MIPANDRAWDKLVFTIASENALKYSPVDKGGLRYTTARAIGVAESLIDLALDATLVRLKRRGKLVYDHSERGWAPPDWRELRETARLAAEQAAEEERIAEFSQPGLLTLDHGNGTDDYLQRWSRLQAFRRHPGFAHSYKLPLRSVLERPNVVADVVARFEPQGVIVFNSVSAELHFAITSDATQYRFHADHEMEAIEN